MAFQFPEDLIILFIKLFPLAIIIAIGYTIWKATKRIEALENRTKEIEDLLKSK